MNIIVVIVTSLIVFVSGDNFRIFGGQLADPGEYPSQASLIYDGTHRCGSTIISDKYLLTAAHCVVTREDPSLLSVQVGTNVWNEGGTNHKISNFTVHPGYNLTDFASEDLAILEVSTPINLNSLVQVAQLPQKDQDTPAGSSAIIIGWGATDESTPEVLDLMEAELRVRDHDFCYNVYESDVHITDAQLCADVDQGGVGPCGGDSGGPLYVNGELVGVASWIVQGCGAKGYPAIFTRVASFRDWIQQITGV